MSNENLATLRDPVNPEAGSPNLEVRSLKLEVGGEMSPEAAWQEMQAETQREKSQVEGLGRASDDPEAGAVTQATVVKLVGIREKYLRQLDSVVNPGEHEATIREPAKVYDFQKEKTLREKRATLRAGFENKQEEDEEINKAIENVLDEQGRTATQKMEDEPSETQETLRSERLRKRMEHVASDFEKRPTVRGTEFVETSPPAESVRAPEAPDTIKDTLKSAEFEDSTLRETESPTIQEVTEIPEEDVPELKLELAVTPQELQAEKNEKVLKATQEGLEELSGDEWSDLYQQSEFAWTPDVWENLSNQAPANETSEREQLRQLAMNKAEMALKLMANAVAIRELGKAVLFEPALSEQQRNLSLEKRKLEEGLAQDKAKEKELFETARERAEAMEVDISELAETPADALAARINKPPSGYTDEELERIAKESAANKTPVSSLERAGGGIMYGTAAVGLAVLAKMTWSLFSGKAAFKVLDWIDKGMEKIQKYAFKNDFSSIFDIAKNTGETIHKKMDESIAKGEKKKEE